jgi:hypothetical protein
METAPTNKVTPLSAGEDKWNVDLYRPVGGARGQGATVSRVGAGCAGDDLSAGGATVCDGDPGVSLT